MNRSLRRRLLLAALIAWTAAGMPAQARAGFRVLHPASVYTRPYNPRYAQAYPWNYNLANHWSYYRYARYRGLPYNPYYYAHPYSAGYYSTPYQPYVVPSGGYLSGSANVMDAQGQFMIANQQAQLLQQQVQQEKLANKRRAFDEWLYEKANTPTLEDERLRDQSIVLQRSLNDPPVTEIYSGRALNAILNNVQQRQAQGIQGPDISLEEVTLQQINVTANPNGSNIGLLKNGGRLDWPLGLEVVPPEPATLQLRQQLQNDVRQALRQAAQGQVDAGLLVKMNAAVNRFNALLLKNIFDQPTMQYLEAKSYLGDLSAAIKALEQPNAGRYLNGTYVAKGRTVRQLVQYMTAQGLQFAAAMPGEEAAYLALQRALAAYDAGLAAQQ